MDTVDRHNCWNWNYREIKFPQSSTQSAFIHFKGLENTHHQLFNTYNVRSMFYIAVWTRNAGDILGNRYSSTSVLHKRGRRNSKGYCENRSRGFLSFTLKSSNVAIMRRWMESTLTLLTALLYAFIRAWYDYQFVCTDTVLSTRRLICPAAGGYSRRSYLSILKSTNDHRPTWARVRRTCE